MSKQVLHKHVTKPGAFGGTLYTTLCRRVRNGQDYNVADTDAEVTCKFCLRAMRRQPA